MTDGEAFRFYYALRDEYGWRSPRKMARKRVENELASMRKFLRWAGKKGVENVEGYMRQRFSDMHRASAARGLPRISQLASDALAERWGEWLGEVVESEALLEASYAERLRLEDELALAVKALGAPPHVTKEATKRRYAAEGAAELCEAQLAFSGGYHPGSAWCVACPRAFSCAVAMREKHGFDVSALRAGRLAGLPDRIVSAFVR